MERNGGLTYYTEYFTEPGPCFAITDTGGLRKVDIGPTKYRVNVCLTVPTTSWWRARLGVALMRLGAWICRVRLVTKEEK